MKTPQQWVDHFTLEPMNEHQAVNGVRVSLEDIEEIQRDALKTKLEAQIVALKRNLALCLKGMGNRTDFEICTFIDEICDEAIHESRNHVSLTQKGSLHALLPGEELKP